MRFTQIRHANGTTELKWQGHHNSDSLVTTLTSEDAPHPGFLKALEALRPQIPKLIGAKKDYAEGVEVRALNISYQKGDRRAFTIHAVKPVAATNAPFNINTPFLLEPDLDSEDAGQASQDLLELFEEIVEQARLFVSGRREQAELFDGQENGAAAVREQRNVDAERAAEIDRIIEYLVGERPDSFEEWDDEDILKDAVAAFDERLKGSGFRQFSHLTASGTRRMRCAIGTQAGVPRIWVDFEGKLDPAQTPATLLGRDLVTAIRRVWSKPKEQLTLSEAVQQEEPAAAVWMREVRPSPAPADTVTTEIVAQCLHSVLAEAEHVRDALYVAHTKGGAVDTEIEGWIQEAFQLRCRDADKVGFSEPIGIRSSEHVQHVTVDLKLSPLSMQVKLTNSKKQKLSMSKLVTIARGMFDISEPEKDE